jgi:peptide/nickel transport system substrate-binding protein
VRATPHVKHGLNQKGAKRSRGGLVTRLCVVVVALGLSGSGSASATSTSLVVDIGDEPASLDPLLVANGPRQQFQWSVYEGLTARHGSKIVPALATKWTLRGKSWIFTLRQGVRFQNGQPFTAADVVASYKREMSPKSTVLEVLPDTIVKAVNASTVSMTRPVADLTTPSRATLIMIAPAKYAALSDNRLSTQMIGTGPYELDSWRRGQSISLSAYKGYWGKQPSIQQVTMKFSQQAAVRLSELKANEIQLAWDVPSDFSKNISKKFKFVSAPISQVWMFRLNTQHGPFMNRLIRQAADLALDRSVIRKTIFGGFATTAEGQIVANYVVGHNPKMRDTPYNPKRARQLLERAGAVGTTIELVGTTGRFASDSDIAQAVASMLNKVGFKTKLELPPFNKWQDEFVNSEHNFATVPDAMLAPMSNELFDSSLIVDKYLNCKSIVSTTCDATITSLANMAGRMTNAKHRAEIFYRIWKIMQEQADFVSIAEVPVLAITVSNLEWTPDPDGFFRFQDMRFTS